MDPASELNAAALPQNAERLFAMMQAIPKMSASAYERFVAILREMGVPWDVIHARVDGVEVFIGESSETRNPLTDWRTVERRVAALRHSWACDAQRRVRTRGVHVRVPRPRRVARPREQRFSRTCRSGRGSPDSDDDPSSSAHARCPACGGILLWQGGTLACANRRCSGYGEAS
jgi:hypothetical protein